MGTDITMVKLLAALLSGALLRQVSGNWYFYPNERNRYSGTKITKLADTAREKGLISFKLETSFSVDETWEVSDSGKERLAQMLVED